MNNDFIGVALILCGVPRLRFLGRQRLTDQQMFDQWYRLEKQKIDESGKWWLGLPRCPQKLDLQPSAKGKEGTEPVMAVNPDASQWHDPKRPNKAEFNLHPGTFFSMRSKADESGHANQCTYDCEGSLLLSPPASGTVDWCCCGKHAHYTQDVAPVYLANRLDGGARMGLIGSALWGGPSILETPGLYLKQYFEVRPIWAEE